MSQATVSRVLNGKPGVAETTRREVLLALTQLGYEAVGVSHPRRTGLVGLIVPELDNPVFPRFAQAIESRLASDGLTTVLCTSTPAGMREGDYIDVLLDHAVTGVVIVSGEAADLTADRGRYLDLAARQLPVVLVNGRTPDLPLPSVTVDHASATLQSVLHLASLGHETIGLAIGPRRYLPTRELIQGYLDGLEQAGLDPDSSEVSEALYSIEGGHAAGLDLLDRGVTGVVCGSDPMALGVIRAVREKGLAIPGEVSVIGFDDAGPNAYVDPALTSIRQPFEAMAGAVVRLLTERIADPGLPPSELRFRPELIARDSTGAAPARTTEKTETTDLTA